MPVPKGEFEGLAEAGLKVDVARAWVKDFLANSEPGKSGHWRKANSQIVTRLEAFLDKAPLWAKADKSFQENDYPAAIATLKRIVSMDAEDHAARLNLASALANSGDHQGALKHFQAIKPTFAGDPEFHVAYAHVFIALQKTDDAVGQFVDALEAKGDHQGALDGLEKLGVLAAIYENPRDAASLTYVRVDSVADYVKGVWDAAERDAAYYLEQLAYHERENRSELALEAAERAVKLGGPAAEERAAVARSAALRGMGRKDEALAAAEAYVAKAPTSAAGQVELAKALAAVGKVDDAKRAVDKALELDPGDQQALWFKYWPKEATDIATLGARLPEIVAFAGAHPTVAGVWRTLARAKLAIGSTDEAIELFEKAVRLAPGDDDLRAEWWGELGKQQRYVDIVKDAEKVEGITKRDWKLRWNEAEAYAGLQRKVEARAAFSAINFDESLHLDIRKRAKRAVKAIDEGNATTT